MTMEKFEELTSSVIPLPVRDIDTDMIIPAEFLTSISRSGYGENVFKRLREEDPEFPFNQDRYKDSQILLVDDNFGCGSSREHAVWALASWGIKAVVGKSFADIFASNASKNGLVTIALRSDIIDELLLQAEKNALELIINLESQQVRLASGEIHDFEFDPFRKHCILNGLDDIDYILSRAEDVSAYRTKMEPYRYFRSTQRNR